jgi:D-alanyl-D-alanine carboxypeptidase
MRNRLLIAAAATAAITVGGYAAVAVADPGTGDATHRPSESALDPQLLQRTLDDLVEGGAPSVVAEVRDGEETWSQASGPRDIGGDTATEPTDQVRVGSLTKSMVVTVLLQLSEEGVLGLDDEVSQHLPGLLPYEEPITVRQLLSHTSGVPDYFPLVYPSLLDGSAADVRTNREQQFSPEEMVELATSQPLDFAPGTEYRYSNTGYYVIGMLLEKLTGQQIEDLITQRVMEPSGLDESYFALDEPVIAGPHPTPYFATGEPDAPLFATDEFSPTQLWAAGAVVSTTNDMNDFFRAMFDGTLLPKDLLDEARTMTEQSQGSYGLGVAAVPAECDAVPGGVAYGHTGGTFGHTTWSFHSPDGNRQVSLTMTIDPQLAPPEGLDVAWNNFAVAGLCSVDVTEESADALSLLPDSGSGLPGFES